MQPQAPYTVNTNGKNGHPVPAEPLQPHNVEAEEAVLGSLMIDPGGIIFIKALLKPADFFIERNGWIYEAISTLSDQRRPADQVTLVDELERKNRLGPVGGSAYLTGLINKTPTSVHLKHYAEIVKRTITSRQLIAGAGEMTRIAYSDQLEPSEMLQRADEILLSISKDNAAEAAKPTSHFCDQVLDDLETIEQGKAVGVPVGINDLDRLTGGFQRGDLIILAGRPGMGKTALATQVLSNSAKKLNKRGLGFSLEMSGKQLMRRLVSRESGVDSRIIKLGPIGDNRPAIVAATNEISRWPISIDDRARTIEEIRSRAIIHQVKYGLDLVVVDYIQEVSVGGKYQNRDSEIGAVGHGLKRLALDLNVPVVAVSSLSRACEKRPDKRPILSDLRESGSLEYQTDLVIFLYRDDYYNKNSETPNITELDLAKHRDGPMDTIQAFWKKTTTTFVGLEIRRQTLDY